MANAHHNLSSAPNASTMIGTTTTFYSDDLNGQQVDADMDMQSYLRHFPQNTQSQFPDYQPSQGFPQYTSQPIPQPNQYLPTPPSVSPTSTSAPGLSTNSYYTLQAPPVVQQSPRDFNFNAASGPSTRKQQPQSASAAKKKGGKADLSSPVNPRKRQKRKSFEDQRAMASESEDEDDAEDKADETKPMQRLPGACRYCKRLKMRCEFPQDSNTCKRCKAGGHQCVVEGRKPRAGPNKREFLLAQLRQKEAIIDSLLKQINNPIHQTPLNLVLPHNATANSPDAQSTKDGIQAWLERLEGTSIKTAGAGRGPIAFALDRRAEHEEEDEEDDGAVGAGDDDGEDGVEGDMEHPEKEKKGKLHSLPEEAAPLGLIANLSLRNSTPRKPTIQTMQEQSPSPAATGAPNDPNNPNALKAEGDENENDIGVANQEYFQPGPATNLNLRRVLVERTMTPEILVHGLVTPADVEELFRIFYDRINPFISILDPVIHTPQRTFGRCPFLFTVVCAVSSRYYQPKAHIYKYAMHFAKSAAASSLIDGFKSVELCQAYLLLSTYSVPARRWEEDRSWLYLGLAIRIATDLNLHQPSSTKPTSEKHERELLNRTRTWLNCFNLDRSTSTQLGKPSTIKEDFIIRNASEWYRRSKYNHPYDVQLCAYTELLRLVTRFHEEVYSDEKVGNGLNRRADFYSITMRYDEQLRVFQERMAVRFEKDSSKDDPGCQFRNGLLPFYVHYSRLVMFSFGFQHAVQRGLKRDDPFFQRCFEAASGVIRVMLDQMIPTGYSRYAPDGHFIFTSFAAAFLLKLLRPDFAGIVTRGHRDNILSLVKRLVKAFGSPDLAVDERHTPKLYSRFLASLVARHSNKAQGGVRKDKGADVNAAMAQQQQQQQQQVQHQDQVMGNAMMTDPLSQQQAHQFQHQFHPQHPSQSHQQPFTSSQPHPGQPNPLTISPTTSYDYASPTAFDTPTGPGSNPGSFEMSNDDFLASMHAIDNPNWWNNVMMPGFTWPEGSIATTPSPGASGAALASGVGYQEQGPSGGYGGQQQPQQAQGGYGDMYVNVRY